MQACKPPTHHALKSATRLIESLVLAEYQRLAPLVNARLDTPMVENAKARKARLDKAWTLLKQEL